MDVFAAQISVVFGVLAVCFSGPALVLYFMLLRKSTLSQLVKRAAAGEALFIGAYGRAEVKLVPVNETERPRRVFGFRKGKINLPVDLEAPLPDEIVRSFEGEE